jgi:hypothetical protein
MRPGETLVYGKMAVTLTGNPDSSAKDGITVYRLELKEQKVRLKGKSNRKCHSLQLFFLPPSLLTFVGW